MQYERGSYEYSKYGLPRIIEEPAQSDPSGEYYVDPTQTDLSDVPNLGIMQGIPETEPYSQLYQIPTDLESEPPIPEEYYETENFGELMSSPPASPSRNPPVPLPQYPQYPQYDHRQQGYNYQPQQTYYSDFDAEHARYPMRMPIHYQQIPPQPSSSSLFTPSSFPDSIPDLSPALSEPRFDSPPLDNDAFQWQPLLMGSKPEASQVKEDKRTKPKVKRKTCLPEGVVEEYVGHTEDGNEFICLYPNCQRLFKRTHNLRSHIQTHLCDRPYECQYCGSRFVRPHDMRRHVRGHTDEKPYMCPCGKRFSRNDAMTRHRMRDICSGSLLKTPKSPKLTKGRSPRVPNSPGLSIKSNIESSPETPNLPFTPTTPGTPGTPGIPGPMTSASGIHLGVNSTGGLMIQHE